MKTLAIAATALLLSAGSSFAAQNHSTGMDNKSHPSAHGFQLHLTKGKYVQIALAKARLAHLRRQAWADGHVTFYERIRIRSAQRNLQRLLHR